MVSFIKWPASLPMSFNYDNEGMKCILPQSRLSPHPLTVNTNCSDSRRWAPQWGSEILPAWLCLGFCRSRLATTGFWYLYSAPAQGRIVTGPVVPVLEKYQGSTPPPSFPPPSTAPGCCNCCLSAQTPSGPRPDLSPGLDNISDAVIDKLCSASVSSAQYLYRSSWA